MAIYTMHGVVRDLCVNCFVHRNMLDELQFVDYLNRRRSAFVGVEDALRGVGDALTIDDSTEAAARAAYLAREYGHQVTLFINPYNVENCSPYFFSVLNVALDLCCISQLTINGIH